MVRLCSTGLRRPVAKYAKLHLWHHVGHRFKCRAFVLFLPVGCFGFRTADGPSSEKNEMCSTPYVGDGFSLNRHVVDDVNPWTQFTHWLL